MTEIIEQIKTLQNENKNMKEQIAGYKYIKEGLEDLKQKIEYMQGKVNITIIKRGKRGSLKRIQEELVAVLSEGKQLTTQIVEKMYPHLNRTQAYIIIRKLSEYPNIDKAYDGRKVRIFKRK